MLQTIIRSCIAVLLLVVTLVTLFCVALVTSDVWSASAKSRYLAHTKCEAFLTAAKTSDESTLQRITSSLASINDSTMNLVDEDLFKSQVSFREMLKGCMETPGNTLRGVLVQDNPTALAARVTDLYNTVLGEKQLKDGTAKPVNMPEAEGGYVHVPEAVPDAPMPITPEKNTNH